MEFPITTAFTTEAAVSAILRLESPPVDVFGWWSVKQIADEMKVAKSNSLYQLLRTLSEDGVLLTTVRARPNGSSMYFYKLSSAYVESLP